MSILKAEFLNCQEISLSVLTARYSLLVTRGPASHRALRLQNVRASGTRKSNVNAR